MTDENPEDPGTIVDPFIDPVRDRVPPELEREPVSRTKKSPQRRKRPARKTINAKG